MAKLGAKENKLVILKLGVKENLNMRIFFCFFDK
jgi:hypothetical protein